MTKSGRFSRRQNRISFAKASSVLGSTQNCAGPPDSQSGVLRERLGEPDFAFRSDDFFQLFRDDQLGRELGQLLVHVAGTETEDEIALQQHPAEIAVQPIEPRLVGNGAVAVLRNRVGDRLAAHPGSARFARRVNIRDHDLIGVVKSRPKFAAAALWSGNSDAVGTSSGRVCARPSERSRAWRGFRLDDARNRRPEESDRFGI